MYKTSLRLREGALMFGYIYKTTNCVNNKVYIGKKQSSKYIPTYLGSGKVIKQAIKKYGREDFANEIIDRANSLEELNLKEKYYVTLYKEALGRDCYNIAGGGDGGNTIKYLPKEMKQDFVLKMTEINKARCSTSEFKEKIGSATKNRYLNPEERKRHSEIVKKAWDNSSLKEQSRERTTNLWKNENYRKKVTEGIQRSWENNEERRNALSQKQAEIWTPVKRKEHGELLKNSIAMKESRLIRSKKMKNIWSDPAYKGRVRKSMKVACANRKTNAGAEARKIGLKVELNNETLTFDSRKSFEDYTREKYGFAVSPKNFNRLLKTGEPYKAYYKKHKQLDGMRIYKMTKSVETMGDECSPVG